MCLSKIYETYESPSSLIQDGMKEFTGYEPNLEFQNMNLRGAREVPLDTWIKAEVQSIKAGDSKYYETGFHVYEDDPKKKHGSKFRRVYVRFITCRGEQDGKKVLIAREMYVPRDPNGWPPKPEEVEKKKESMIDKAKKIIKPGNA